MNFHSQVCNGRKFVVVKLLRNVSDSSEYNFDKYLPYLKLFQKKVWILFYEM